MINLLPAAIGYVVFAGFAGFIAFDVAEPPLVIIIVAVLAMCLIDFWRDLRG